MAKKTVRKAGKGVKKTAKVERGSKYNCRVCGLVVCIDEVCSCVDVCDIICCGANMKEGK